MANSTRQQVVMPNTASAVPATATESKPARSKAAQKTYNEQIRPIVEAEQRQAARAQGFTIPEVTAEEVQASQDWDASFGKGNSVWPREAVQILAIGEDAYPAELLKINNPPEVLYYLGNLNLLKEPSVAVTITRYSEVDEERLAKYSQRQMKDYEYNIAAYKENTTTAKKSAAYLASHGKTIVVSTIRDADLPIMSGALTMGGSVIVVLPSSIDHSQLDLNFCRKYVEEGRLLFISQFEKERTWNIKDAGLRIPVMAALSGEVVVIGASSLNAGLGAFTAVARIIGKRVHVRVKEHNTPAEQELLNVYQCSPISGKSIGEALASLVDPE